jgi:hypothetical protein
MLDQNALQDHPQGTACSGSLAFPSAPRLRDMMVDARMNLASQDREALVQARAPLVEIGDPLNLEVVADLCRGRIDLGRNSSPGDPRGPGGTSQGIGARNRGATGPCHDL